MRKDSKTGAGGVGNNGKLKNNCSSYAKVGKCVLEGVCQCMCECVCVFMCVCVLVWTQVFV